MAAALKEKGNAAFKAGNYAEAVGHYSSAIFSDRSDYTLPLNRAAAYLKLGKYNDAERDCSAVLSLSKKNVKALFRRAQARSELNNLEGAESDLTEALELEPGNVPVKQELAKLHARPSTSKSKAKGKVLNDAQKKSDSPRRVRVPIQIVDEKTSSPPSKTDAAPTIPRRRVPIKIVEEPLPNVKGKQAQQIITTAASPREETASSTENTAPAGPTGSLTTTKTDDLMRPVSSRSIDKSPSTTSPMVATTAPSAQPKALNGGIFRHSTTSSRASDTRKDTKKEESQSTKITSNLQATSKVQTRTPPATLYDLTKQWSAASSHSEKWQIISSIPPSAIKPLFGNSLTPALLMSIVETFQFVSASLNGAANENEAFGDGELVTKSAIRTYITSLSSIDRFAIVVMFLNEAERGKARELLESVGVSRNGWGL